MATRGKAPSGPGGEAGPTPRGDFGTGAAALKLAWDAGRAGLEFGQKLIDISKGEAALVVTVVESFAQDGCFFLLLRVQNYSPHGVVIEQIVPAFPADKVTIASYLLVEKEFSATFESGAALGAAPTMPDVGLRLSPFASPVRVPAGKAQEFLLSWDRQTVLSKIHNLRRGAVTLKYEILGSDGDPKDEPVKFRFRDDRPPPAAFTRP